MSVELERREEKNYEQIKEEYDFKKRFELKTKRRFLIDSFLKYGTYFFLIIMVPLFLFQEYNDNKTAKNKIINEASIDLQENFTTNTKCLKSGGNDIKLFLAANKNFINVSVNDNCVIKLKEGSDVEFYSLANELADFKVYFKNNKVKVSSVKK